LPLPLPPGPPAARISASYLIPEGLIEFVPEMKVLIANINDMLARDRSL
jgi:hypothetical protein